MSAWMTVFLATIIIGTVAAVVVVLTLGSCGNKRKRFSCMDPQWCVELWNIRYGFKIQLRFSGSLVVGRYDLYQDQAISMDTTISREHVLLYEQGENLWAWNLSSVNPAMVNGHRLNAPLQILPGDRLELGNSVFLITEITFL